MKTLLFGAAFTLVALVPVACEAESADSIQFPPSLNSVSGAVAATPAEPLPRRYEGLVDSRSATAETRTGSHSFQRRKLDRY